VLPISRDRSPWLPGPQLSLTGLTGTSIPDMRLASPPFGLVSTLSSHREESNVVRLATFPNVSCYAFNDLL
jgi:hypothetical protein